MTASNDTGAASDYPEHDKLCDVTVELEIISTFLEESGFILAEYRDVEGFAEQRLTPVHGDNQQILANYLKIDLLALGREQVRILETIRELSNTGTNNTVE
jgi:nitrogen regulatory protein PII